MEKKYQVFISSTFNDLKEERIEIMEALINLGHIPVGMELFNAADDTQWGVIKRRIEESDYYVLLLSDRYGSIDADGTGFTEKEYDFAVSINKPVISFVRDNFAINELQFEFRESDNKKRLEDFKNKVATRLYKPWTNKHDLSKKFFLAFAELIREKPQSGWVRYESVEQNSQNQTNKLLFENQKLSEEFRSLHVINSRLEKELDELKNVKSKVDEILKILPTKYFTLGTHNFNGVELIGLFGGFVSIEGPITSIINSIKEFMVIQTQDEESWKYEKKNSLNYIIGSFASLGLVEIKTEVHILHQEDGHENHFSKEDKIQTIEIVKPTQLLTEVYIKVESTNIASILRVQNKSDYQNKKRRLEELANFMEVAWEGNNEKFIAKKRGKIDSIISEFISHYIWNSEEEKTNFFNLDFLNDNKSLNILFSIANKVLEEKNKQNVV